MQASKQWAIAVLGPIAMGCLGMGSVSAADLRIEPGPPQYQRAVPQYGPGPVQEIYPAPPPVVYGYAPAPPPVVYYDYPPPVVAYAPPYRYGYGGYRYPRHYGYRGGPFGRWHR